MNISPHVRESESLEFMIPHFGFRTRGTGFRPILIVSGIQDSLSCIPDSKAYEIAGFCISVAKDSRIQIPF